LALPSPLRKHGNPSSVTPKPVACDGRLATPYGVTPSRKGRRDRALASKVDVLSRFAILAAIFWSVLFVVVGLRYELQIYGDGSLFSYSVAAQDAWAFHWHNISGRIFVYLFCYLPAEAYVGLFGDAHGGIVVYGLLFFVAPLLSLIATFVVDRSQGRIFFGTACASTACLCPLVFGAPTEMWFAHSLFWPSLALCHYARRSIAATALIFAAFLALVFTHEGAVILEIAILCTLLLRGPNDASFLRAAGVFIVVLAIWVFVKTEFPPDGYDSAVLARAALDFFDLSLFTSGFFLLLAGALFFYAIVFLLFRRLASAGAPLLAAALVAVALAVYWLWFDRSLHAENRYYMRTLLLVGTLAFGTLAARAVAAEGKLRLPIPFLPQLLAALRTEGMARAILGAFLLVTLIHAVETVKFVRAWNAYKNAVRTLAMSTISDPNLGDPRFVSSARIGDDLNRLAWFSTTQFLSVLVAPNFLPARLVMDPRDPSVNYFWLSCATATANEEAKRAIPVESRRLIRIYSCLHRRD
jgi:hypothetical protein